MNPKVLTYKTEKPVCKKCKGELDSISLVTSAYLSGQNNDVDNGASIACHTNSVSLFSCNNQKCKWHGLLTQIVSKKIVTGKLINGSWNQESEEIK